MATLHSFFLFKFLVLLHSSLLLLPILANTSTHGFHTVHVNSFSQYASTCKPYKGSTKTPSTLKLFHRYGPCSPLNRGQIAPPLSEILSRDESRVQSIQARVARDSNFNDLKADLPTQSGLSLGTGNYIVSVGLGTPAKRLSLAFDTGSDLTWTQCQPCSNGSCYAQNEPIFDPSSSSSYSNVPCNTPECSQASAAAGQNSACTETSCTYYTRYGDGSSSRGLISKDTITLTPTDTFPNFVFGCGQENSNGFGTTAGILGLGMNPTSIISQTEQKYNKYFSYCIPSTRSSTGHLTLGKTESSTSNTVFTPFAMSKEFYYIELVGITVGGRQLSIDPAIFTSAKTIIDSGTVITRLPRTAYNALSQAFQEMMTNYTRVTGTSLLDTCYDFSSVTTVMIPKIAFTFGGNAVVDIKPPGIFSIHSMEQVCLAFAGNEGDNEVGLFGNTQQKTYEVVYDVAGGNLGFGEGGCN